MDKIETRESSINSLYNSFLYFKNKMKIENKLNISIGSQILSYYWIKVLIYFKFFRSCKIKELKTPHILSVYLKILNKQ